MSGILFSKLIDTLMVFLKEFFIIIVNFENALNETKSASFFSTFEGSLYFSIFFFQFILYLAFLPTVNIHFFLKTNCFLKKIH